MLSKGNGQVVHCSYSQSQKPMLFLGRQGFILRTGRWQGDSHIRSAWKKRGTAS